MVFKKKLKEASIILIFTIFSFLVCRYISNLINLVNLIFGIDINYIGGIKLDSIYEYRFMVPLFILIIGCIIFIILIDWSKTKSFGKNALFYFIMFILLILSIELILSAGGFFYYNIYSNLDSAKIEEDAFRILFLGESTTMGQGVSKENAYPAQICEILNQTYSDRKIRCYNRGIGGIETTAILRNIDKNLIKYKPNLVILMAGTNGNSVLDIRSLKLRYIYSKSKTFHLFALLKDLYKIEHEKDFLLEGDNFRYRPDYDYGYIFIASDMVLNLNIIIDKVKNYGSEIYLSGYLQPDSMGRVNPILQEISEENNITYIGDYPEVDFKINQTLFADDGWHPSAEGHKLIADKIAEKIIDEEIINEWGLGF